MIVACECGAKLRLDDSKITEKGVKVRCPRCGNILLARKPAPTPAAVEAPAAPKAPTPIATPSSLSSITVLVAHESEAVRNMISDVLLDAEFKVETAAEGVETLKKAGEARPEVMVLDVGLPGIYGFELCERLKDDKQTSGIKIILLTSTYDMTRYKRTPISLYGADDYIEKHHVADQLVLKIRKLIYPEEYAEAPAPAPEAAPPAPDVKPAVAAAPPPKPAVAAPAPAKEKIEEELFSPSSLLKMESEPPASSAASLARTPHTPAQSSWLDTFIQQAQDGAAMAPDSFTLESSIFEKRESDIPSVDASDPQAVEKAKRFARIIVSDIALYNQEAVREGIQNGTFFELLKDDVEEGRQLYEKRVPEMIRKKKDFYREAFDNFIEAQKKIVR